MVTLSDNELKMPGRKSSKGNQLKFEKDGIWYKADYLGYEGFAEYVISGLLAHSDLNRDEYVTYNLDRISYNGQVFNGCASRDFTDGWQLVTLERLFKQSYGSGLNHMIYSIEDHTERLEMLVEQVERLTGIEDFGQYMCKVLTVDALFLNDDRHTHNIAVLTDGQGHYKPSPIFDNGAGLLSDTMLEYPMNRDVLELIDLAQPKTFCDDFAQQLEIAENLYGRTISFDYDYNDISNMVKDITDYSEDIRQRVIEVVMQTRRKYQYLFK